MVVSGLRTALVPALVVPDEQTWTLSGRDPAVDGVRPVFAPGEAACALLPERVPGPLEEPLRALLAELPAGTEVRTRALSIPHAAGVGHGAHHEHAGNHMPAEHDSNNMGGGHAHMDHGHGHMMAIVGEPSADGLVMEPIELRFGPLATPLPGGLSLDVTLDGDVVADSSVKALLDAEAPSNGTPPGPPDPLAPVAWTLAIDGAAQRADGAPWRRVAALEVERALSHLSWLRALGRLLGWSLLVERCAAALEGLPPLPGELGDPSGEGHSAAWSTLERALTRADALSELVRRSRSLRLRSAGLAAVTGEQARQAGVRGPVARASGLRDDARAGHPLYEQLRFEPAVQSAGDAHARTLIRAEEAHTSLRLALAALEADADDIRVASLTVEGELEGPRGPLRARRLTNGWELDAAGAEETRRMAAEAMVGLEWSAALVAAASFDLSPCRVGA